MRSSVPALAALLLLPSAQAAQITVQPNDPTGEGFKDETAFTPEGGNNATTLGEARRNVFRAAAEQWGAVVDSDVEIVVRASFAPAPDDECSSREGTLGAAGPSGFIARFRGAPRDDTFYPIALANALAGEDLDPGAPDIVANFNGAVDTDPDCLRGLRFYYGFDHAGGSGTIDFYNVVMHELAHGLGFSTLIEPDGANPATPDFYALDRLIFDNSQDRFWDAMSDAQRAASVTNERNVANAGVAVQGGAVAQGLDGGNGTDTDGRPLIYTPSPFEGGSSIAHWDTEAEPSLLMEPFATADVRSNTGVDMTSCLLQDLGWQLAGGVGCPDDHAADTPPEIDAIDDQSLEAGSASAPIAVGITDNSRVTPDDSLTLQGFSDAQAVLPDSGIRFGGSGGQRELTLEAGDDSGNATVTVIVSDGTFTARERFDVAVTAPSGNQPPVARADVVETLSTESLSGNVLADNGNGADSDPDGDALRVAAVDGSVEQVGEAFTTERGAELRITADGSFRYTPGGEMADLQPSRQQAESVTYRISDDRGGSDSDSISFIVTGDPGTDQHGDDVQTATEIEVTANVRRFEGAINTRGDRDFFTFALAEPAEVLLRTTGDTDTVGTLRDAGGVRVAESDDAVRDEETDVNFRIEASLAAGRYSLEVAGFEDRATGDYALEATAAPSAGEAPAGDDENAEDSPGGGNSGEGSDGTAGSGAEGGSGGALPAWLLLPLVLSALWRRRGGRRFPV